MVTVVPFLGIDAISIVPPNIVMILWTRERPMPDPLNSMALLALYNGCNRSFFSDSGISIPLSAI